MNDSIDREWQTMIRAALSADAVPELDQDLWPRMRARLAAPRPSLSRWDLLLLAAIVVLAAAFPDVILSMLYHL